MFDFTKKKDTIKNHHGGVTEGKNKRKRKEIKVEKKMKKMEKRVRVSACE